MTEFFTIKRIDNSRLVRPVAPDRVRDGCRRVACGAVLAACGLLYTWQHFQCIQLRYELEDLQARRTQTAELNQELRVEVASLRSPGRIDAIARKLGLTVPVPGQVSPVEGPSEAVLAQARMAQPARP
jgi:cell division protein FtsL